VTNLFNLGRHLVRAQHSRDVRMSAFAARASAIGEELPDVQSEFLDLNAELRQSCPNVTEVKLPPKDADEWKD